jgi:hypothetical protein
MARHSFYYFYAVAAGLCLIAWLFRRQDAAVNRRTIRGQAVAVGLVVLSSALFAIKVGFIQPFSPTGADALAKQVATWLRQHNPDGGLVLISYSVLGVYITAPSPAGKPFRYEWMNTERVEQLPAGAWVAWESSWSDKVFHKVSRSFLDSHPDFELAATFKSEDTAYRLYRRTKGEMIGDEQFRRLTRRHWPDRTGDGMSKPR